MENSKNENVTTFGILEVINWYDFADNKSVEIEDEFYLIPSKLQLRKLTEEECKAINSAHFPPSVHREIDYISFELKNATTQTLSEEGEYNTFERALLAFRLFRSGYIFLDGIYTIYSDSKSVEEWLFTEPIPQLYPPYIIDPNEIENVIDILNKLERVDFDNNPSIRIACNRFNRSYHVLRPEDKLIDLCIGFEALFLGGEYTTRKGLVIGVACSMLLGNNKEEREKISKNIEGAFDQRNKIVHGKEFDYIKVQDLISDLEDYLRKSILRLIP